MSEEAFLRAAMAMRSKLYHAAMAILWNEQDAADALQDAMLKGWKRRDSLRDEARFEVWFMRVLVNQCRDVQRRQARGRRLLNDAGQRLRFEQAPAPSTELFEAIHRLPDRLRLPVLLYYFDGYTHREIGNILNATPEQVKTRVRQGREKLKAMLTESEGGDGHGRA